MTVLRSILSLSLISLSFDGNVVVVVVVVVVFAAAAAFKTRRNISETQKHVNPKNGVLFLQL